MSIKVLLIDDDPAITELIGMLLQSYGLQALSANDSENGLQLFIQEKPDVVLLDLMMPGKTGWDICREIRAFSQTPIAILSALDDPKMIASALDAGADDYMVKPMPGSELLAHINNLVRRAQAENQKLVAPLRNTGALAFASKPLQA